MSAREEYGDKIYIASKTKYAARWRDIAEFYPVSSTWIYEAGEGETADYNDLWSRCIREASESKAIVIYREPNDVLKGAWIELGAALVAGVPVHAVGMEEFTIAKYSRITHHKTMKEAVSAALREPARALASEGAAGEAAPEPISLRDPLIILAGIEQFGLAPDGSDLRDLRAVLTAPPQREWRVLDGCADVGTPVQKVRGYPFPGEVRAVFKNRAGLVRYVVEATGSDYAGMLHIFSPDQIAPAPQPEGRE